MSRDNATLSNYHQLRTTHTHLDWSIDWPRQLISGTATLTLKPEGKGAVNEVVLDTSFLDIRAVRVDAADVKWTKAERIQAMGEALTIRLEEPKLDAFKVEIEYSTTKECTALGWLTKEYVFPCPFRSLRSFLTAQKDKPKAGNTLTSTPNPKP